MFVLSLLQVYHTRTSAHFDVNAAIHMTNMFLGSNEILFNHSDIVAAGDMGI